ncbi:BnaA08g11550D [Brassica napus]|uniref:BnaA08g11550D protein n=1 Tax=Brassica napus TaxID=3708 RepID=A0A078IEI2_BRANA|nr:BnaA08g11550D [Brassica napus]
MIYTANLLLLTKLDFKER